MHGRRDGMYEHVLLVGGGLHNGLLALALLDAFPALRVTLLERSKTLGGNHTWSFHASDVSEQSMSWLRPLVGGSWPAYEVRFPAHSRRIEGGYFSLFSDRFHEHLCERFADNANRATLKLGCVVDAVHADRVSLADGSEIHADCVVDGRGPTQFDTSTNIAGYQKFVGLELELHDASPLLIPLLMDARVEQTDGFRFVYVLPLSERSVLVEDTYYADGPELDVSAIRSEVLSYAHDAGMRVARVVREEQGVLPLPTRMQLTSDESGPRRIGYAAGFFHPTTGYSLPLAVRVAEHIRAYGPARGFGSAWNALQSETQTQQRFACLLNRLLFRAIARQQRYRVLERFYRLPPATIERFYSLTLSTSDRARILCGRPPAGMSLPAAFSAGVLS